MKKILLVMFLLLGTNIGCTVVDDELLELVLEIKNQNQELLEEVKALQAKSDSLINELKNSAAKQEEVLKKVTDLQAELVKVLAQIGTLNEQLGAQNADLDEIKSQLADLQEKYQGILEQLEQLQKLSQILAEIEKLKGQLAELDGKYQVIQGSLAENKEQLDALKGLVANLQTQLAENLTKISQLTSQLGEQGADIEKILAAIEELKKSCAELKSLIELELIGKSPVPTNGLVAWFPFNGNTLDESGNENHGTSIGATLTTDRKEKSNSAYSFDGVNDYVSISPPLSELNAISEISISTWVLKDGSGLGTYFGHWIDSSQPSSPIGITQTINDTNKFGLAMVGGQGTQSSTSVSLNIWTNITLVYNGKNTAGTKLKLYLNGVFIENLPDNNIPSLSGSLANKTYIGANAAFPDNFNNAVYQFFKGKIDDMAIWNRALTADEISKIYKGEGF